MIGYPLTEEEANTFTVLQISVLNEKKLHTYEDIIRMHPEISTPKQVSEILRQTLHGNKFELGTRGRMPLVGDAQMLMFQNQIQTAADMNRSITMFEAITLLQQIQGDYLWGAYNRAMEIGCPNIAQSLLFYQNPSLSNQWFTTTLKKWNISVKNAADLEQIRDKYCHSNVLRRFYQRLIAFLPQNSQLLYNADETASTFTGAGKVLVPDGHFPVRYSSKITTHFTSICCFNAAGSHILKPFIILPRLQRFPTDLTAFKEQAVFATSANGWITNKLFLAFAVYFCHEVSAFRMQSRSSETVWLILDGHKSRLNSKAIEYFVKNNISVLILPAHTSHVTQPFDVGLAAPMKTKIRNLVSNPGMFIKMLLNTEPCQAARDRITIVGAIINAWAAVATPANCSSAFAAAGISPYNFEGRVLTNRFVRQTNGNDVEEQQRGIAINGKILTSDQKRLEIANFCYNAHFTSVDQIPSKTTAELMTYLKEGPEHIFYDLPPLFSQVINGVIFVI